MTAFFIEGRPSGGVYLTSPLVSLAAEASTAEIGVLFLGSPIPRLITASPRSRRSRASSFRAKVGDSAISLASLLNFMILLDVRLRKYKIRETLPRSAWQNKIWSENSSDQI